MNNKYLQDNVVDKELKYSELALFIASRQFLSVAVIAIVLGVISATGVIQEPRKLKLVVDAISYKVMQGGELPGGLQKHGIVGSDFR